MVSVKVEEIQKKVVVCPMLNNKTKGYKIDNQQPSHLRVEGSTTVRGTPEKDGKTV